MSSLILRLFHLQIVIVLGTANQVFPRNFLFGIASSAYQIEGGHDANGKGESIWDYTLRVNPALVVDLSNGSVACDSYHQYETDLALLDDLGVDFYRFSISWSRLLPNGQVNQINPDGLIYYNKLIDGLVAKGIKPMVTLYHWDLPKALQDLGGWSNPLLTDYFADYARVAFEHFGDRVKYWITVSSSSAGYGDADWPPQINQSGIGEYLFIKNVIVGHAKAYHLYQDQYKKRQNGLIGFTIDGKWFEPLTQSPENRDAAERARQFTIGLYANPIFGDGDFPELCRTRIDSLSEEEGFFHSRLPRFTPEEKQLVKGAFDFFGLNIYTTFLIEDGGDNKRETSYNNDVNVRIYQDPSWPRAASRWLRVTPEGVRKVLDWIRRQYGNPPIYITENGYSDHGELDDLHRIDYLKRYLSAILMAITEDGVNVKAYSVWSLLDNFEWLSGYTEKFGLYHVDFNDPNRKRTPKASSIWYKNLIKHKNLDDEANIKNEL